MMQAIEQLADVPVIRFAARWLTLLSLAALVLLAIGQQGGIGSSLDPVPERPLPIDRHQLFGIDLMDRSSAAAVQWLNDSQEWTPAIVVASDDADITAAIADEDDSASGLHALDSLISAADGQPMVLCLREPLAPQTTEELANAIVEVIVDEHSRQVAYVTTCDEEGDGEWHAAITDALGRDDDPAMIPVASAPPLERVSVNGFHDLAVTNLRSFAGERYVIVSVPVSAPPGPVEVQTAQDAIRNAAQIATVILRPGGEVNASTFAQPLGNVAFGETTLVEGFNSVRAPQARAAGSWDTAQIGVVEYFAAEEPGASITVSFIGTSLYMHAIEGPDAGRIAVWIDDPANPDVSTADEIIDLSAEQATDTAVPIADDLPAATHEITVVALDGDTSVSGFFVSGEPQEQWAGGLATISLILLIIISLTMTSIARVRDIRRRTRAPAAENPYQSFRSGN
ncbi:MAG: hypothetical protein ACOC9Y_09900 [Chloroflexota bacterium]